jgi:hypothetical protein
MPLSHSICRCARLSKIAPLSPTKMRRINCSIWPCKTSRKNGRCPFKIGRECSINWRSSLTVACHINRSHLHKISDTLFSANPGLFHRRRERPVVSALMAQTAPSLSTLCQLQRFLARLFVFAHGHASADRQRDGANGPHRTLEQHATPTLEPLGTQDAVVFQTRIPAEFAFQALCLLLQSGASNHMKFPLPRLQPSCKLIYK